MLFRVPGFVFRVSCFVFDTGCVLHANEMVPGVSLGQSVRLWRDKRRGCVLHAKNWHLELVWDSLSAFGEINVVAALLAETCSVGATFLVFHAEHGYCEERSPA